MCGIVGYIGFRRADEVIIKALKRLEYRGYDSWGIAIKDNGGVLVHKKTGAIGKVEKFSLSNGRMAIGHTRWATHGEPNDVNAHPHTDCSEAIAVVHNGIITNFQELKEVLTAKNHVFKSETDTEVLAHLIEEFYDGDLKEAVEKALSAVKGSYAIAVIHANEDKIVVARNKSPLILGVGDDELFVASDTPAILDYTNRVIFLEDGEIAELEKEVKVFRNGKPVDKEAEIIPWSIEDAEKGGYEHFMLKEIHEIPRVIDDTLSEHMDREFDLGYDKFVFVACGTSYHAGLIAKHVIEKVAKLPVRVEIASEFNYHPPPERATYIAITQSGETADTLEAMRLAKKLGNRVVTIANVLGSTATRIADETLFTRAGPEISVAATKSFISQLIVIYVLAFKLSNRIDLLNELEKISGEVRKILDNKEDIEDVAEILSKYRNLMYVGRGIAYPTAMEGALKMKEISYIHAEAYPAGELKHGPFALLGKDMPVIACVVRDETYEIMLNNIKEIKARGSFVLAISDENDEEIEKYVDHVVKLPAVNPLLTPITQSVALQLLAYYTAKLRGCEIDKPRNLAKSVTVE